MYFLNTQLLPLKQWNHQQGLHRREKGHLPYETREARENEQCRWNSEKHEGDRLAGCQEQHSPTFRATGDHLQPSHMMATGSTWGTSSTATGDQRTGGLMSRQLSNQRSSLLKRSQRTSELAEITPKATLLLLLVLQVTQVELPGQAGLQLTLQEAFTEQLCYFQPRGESSASCRDASIATRRSFSHPTLLHPVAFHLSFCSQSKSVLITWLFHTTL